MTVPATAPPPASGLGSNSNYILSSDCNPILDLFVTINVTQDIVCESSSPAVDGYSAPGFGFQLNAFSPDGETAAWQQYVICHSLGVLTGVVDNWPLAAGPHLFAQEVDLALTPGASTVPAGYQLQVSLKNGGWRNSWDLAVTGGWGGPGNTGLLLYDRAAGTGAFYAVGARGELTPLAQYADWPTSWDLAVTGDWGGPGNTGLLLYDRAAGRGAFYAVGAQGELTLLQDYAGWRTSWDLIVAGGWGGPGNSGLLLYDRAAGSGVFYAVNARGEMTLRQDYEDWPTSWDLAVTGSWGGPGNTGLLLYDRAAGVGALYAVGGDAAPHLMVESNNWGTSWDVALTGGWGGPGNIGLLLYDRAAGSAAFFAIGPQGEKTPLADYEGWRTSWDLIVAGGWGGPGASGLLLYDKSAWFGAWYAVDSQAAMTLLAKSDSSVTGATFAVTGADGAVLASETLDLASIPGVSADQLAPITAFELNLVGPFNGESTVLSSGAGTIVYRASSPLTALSQEPPCVESGAVTGETANSVYGLLPAGPSDSITQSFSVTRETMIRKEGKARPGLIVSAR
jgi:hypothetical protein